MRTLEFFLMAVAWLFSYYWLKDKMQIIIHRRWSYYRFLSWCIVAVVAIFFGISLRFYDHDISNAFFSGLACGVVLTLIEGVSLWAYLRWKFGLITRAEVAEVVRVVGFGIALSIFLSLPWQFFLVIIIGYPLMYLLFYGSRQWQRNGGFIGWFLSKIKK